MGIRLEFTLPSGATGHYAFELGGRAFGANDVLAEECIVRNPTAASEISFFRVDHGTVETSVPTAPVAMYDRLYLVNASNLPEFRPVYELLSRMAFYNLNAEQMRYIQASDPGDVLARDGSNVASVVRRITEQDPETKARIEEYLAHITDGIQRVDTSRVGSKEMLIFEQRGANGTGNWRFGAESMSDGTLRALGILVALFQSRAGRDDASRRIPLVGIEEPELAVHPAVVGVLLDTLRDASHTLQVLVTSHSPDLLDDDDIETETILAVVSEEGLTRIGPLDDVGRSILRDRLFTAGGPLRIGQMRPTPNVAGTAGMERIRLFDDESA